MVELDKNLLAPTATTRIAENMAYHMELFDADERLELVPALDEADARTIPAALLPQVLNKELDAKSALLLLYPLVVDLGIEAVSGPLLDFLIAATTATPAGTTTVTSQTTSGSTPQGILEVVHDRRLNLLYRHLPTLRPTQIRSNPALTGIMHAVQNATNANIDNLADAQANREQAAVPKTIEDRWPTYVDRLCIACNVERWEDLPPFWHRAAVWKKGDGSTGRSILQESVALAADQLGVSSPHVTVQHWNAIQNWNFVGASMTTLSSGLMPFTVTPPGAVSAEAQLRHATEFEQSADHSILMEGSLTMTNADARALRSLGRQRPNPTVAVPPPSSAATPTFQPRQSKKLKPQDKKLKLEIVTPELGKIHIRPRNITTPTLLSTTRTTLPDRTKEPAPPLRSASHLLPSSAAPSSTSLSEIAAPGQS